uniref:Uncharacterized protein n=1 Tax=Oryza punctata TaxID=4537 RepID=A0A0E0JUN4_ORYPU
MIQLELAKLHACTKWKRGREEGEEITVKLVLTESRGVYHTMGKGNRARLETPREDHGLRRTKGTQWAEHLWLDLDWIFSSVTLLQGAI